MLGLPNEPLRDEVSLNFTGSHKSFSLLNWCSLFNSVAVGNPDWNNEFIEQLLDAGYAGESNEEIVDLWFKDLARNVLEDEGHDPNRGAGFINTKNLGDGKSEVK